MTKLVLSALLSCAVGAAATYATIHVTATCSQPVPAIGADNGMTKFLAQPDAPLTGYPTYK